MTKRLHVLLVGTAEYHMAAASEKLIVYTNILVAVQSDLSESDRFVFFCREYFHRQTKSLIVREVLIQYK